MLEIFHQMKRIFTFAVTKISNMDSMGYVTLSIGNKVKELRKKSSATLGELSQKSGVSIAMLSKIENGRVFPTLPTLIQIITSMDIDINEFFSDIKLKSDFEGYIHTKAIEQERIDKEDIATGFEYFRIFGHSLNRSSMEVNLLQLQPGAKRDSVTTSGMELIYVLNGKLDYQLGSSTLQLQTGDTLFFDGNIEHTPINNSGEVVQLFVIYFITISD